MAWFTNMKIGVKLISSFILIACIAGVIGLIGVVNIKNIDNADTELYQINTLSVVEMSKWQDSYNGQRVVLRDIVLSDDAAYQQQRMENLKQYQEAMKTNMAELKSKLKESNQIEAMNALNAANDEYVVLLDEILSLGLAGNKQEATQRLQVDTAAMVEKVDVNSAKLFSLITEGAKKKSDSNSATANQASVMMVTLIVVGMVIAVGLGVIISRMISKPIHTLVQASQKVADGDMNVTIDIRSKDEIGNLAQAFATMTDSMNDVLQNITNASEQVASGSRQVSEASQSLSQGSTEQASSIQQLTASMEQIASQTKQNARSAEEANQLAVSASADAEQGNTQMKGMLTAMEEINESSGNISKIIKVIDEIAFQTNILALNAAVEAARAGQHGKGFAVVAEEVRNLAARSANAAKETTVLIEGSIKKVEAGTKIAHDTAEALDKIVTGVNKAATLVGSIASASNEQAIGITQVNQGIAQVSDVIQANSATSEECAAASEELSGQSDQLKEMVSRFRLKRNTSAAYWGRNGSEVPEAKRARFASSFAHPEVAAASTGKVRIQLDDNDFGKYE
ncbi:methyl-accepting chemotaxis protein [Paenibacillus sp. TRM 82003]|nr:methyl-accepting chemotaxis protein [Paenibacillus sp. TRM 82003]